MITTETPGATNYVDIIVCAKMQSLEDTDHILAAMPWAQVPAFKKLGINTEDHDDELDDLTEEIEAATTMLQGG